MMDSLKGTVVTTMLMGGVSVITFLVSSYFGGFASLAEVTQKAEFETFKVYTSSELSTIRSEVSSLKEFQKEMRDDIKFLVREERKRQ